MKHTLEVHLWGFQGQTVDYSAGIWGSNVLSKSSFQGRLPHDNRNYKDVIPKGLSWRFDSSDSECAITCFQMIPLKDRPSDFFAGTVVFPRGTAITEEQLQELQRKVSTAIEVLGRIVTKMRPDEMGPLEGELRSVEDKERLERPHEICVIPQDSKFTLGGLVRKLVELRHNQLTVFIVEPQNGQAAGHDELKAIEAVAQKSHPEAAVVVASDFDGLQQEDNRRYQELLDFRAEQQRIAEEKERADKARKAEEERRRQEEERERQRRNAQLLEVFKKASKVLGVLAVVAGLGYGGYTIKDDVADLFRKVKHGLFDRKGSADASKTNEPPHEEFIDCTELKDSTIVRELNWKNGNKYIEHIFTLDSLYSPGNTTKEEVQDPQLCEGVDVYVEKMDSSIQALGIVVDPESKSIGQEMTLRLNASKLPGLPVSSFVIVLKKSEDELVEQAPENGDSGDDQESPIPAEDSTSVKMETPVEETP